MSEIGRISYEIGGYSVFYRDEISVYVKTDEDWLPHKVEGADPKTFTIVSTYYAKDRQFVYQTYSETSVFYGADVDTFVGYSNSVYSKDKNHVYEISRIVPEADPLTFQLVVGHTDYDAQDKNHRYFLGQIMQ